MRSNLVLLTALIAAAIRMALLQSRMRGLEAQAITDPLTGAFNHRHLQNTLATAVERRRRSGERASLLLFDIDRFKRINDALGHPEGDRVLKTLVALIGQRMRKVDVLFRCGGEEFALLLAGAKFADALCVAEDIRRVVQDAGLVPGRPMSISVGVVELAHEQSAEEWLAEGDAALYRAKRAGRNRVAGQFGDPARFANKQSGSNRIPFPARIS